MRIRLRVLQILLIRLWRFSRYVVATFMRHRGLLLAGGVGYNFLLSIVPLAAVVIVSVSAFVDEDQLLDAIALELRLLVPMHEVVILEAVRAFLSSRVLIGNVGILVLLFFSSIAFRMLEEAISIIFYGYLPHRGRSFWLSMLIPYAYILVLSVGLLLATFLVTALEALEGTVSIMGLEVFIGPAVSHSVDLLSFVFLVFVFTSIYMVLPVAKIAFRRALWGGVTAALMWVGVAQLLGYYFRNISLVNVLYGSLATVVVILLMMEVAAIILLLGAQVIAELERRAALGLRWHESGPRRTSRGGVG